MILGMIVGVLILVIGVGIGLIIAAVLNQLPYDE